MRSSLEHKVLEVGEWFVGEQKEETVVKAVVEEDLKITGIGEAPLQTLAARLRNFYLKLDSEKP